MGFFWIFYGFLKVLKILEGFLRDPEYILWIPWIILGILKDF